jgi:ABC-type proline/glycine betaine transport system ATPase subunit
MRQRVGIARAFALSPKMLLLDEPFGMLDSLTRFELQQVLIELWRKDRKTALMVTHDVDEALFLADRIVMMTNGPEAEVGDVLEVKFPRPRDRKAVMEHPDYYKLREHLITFLEVHAHKASPSTPAEDLSPPPSTDRRASAKIRKANSTRSSSNRRMTALRSAQNGQPEPNKPMTRTPSLITNSALVLAASAALYATAASAQSNAPPAAPAAPQNPAPDW